MTPKPRSSGRKPFLSVPGGLLGDPAIRGRGSEYGSIVFLESCKAKFRDRWSIGEKPNIRKLTSDMRGLNYRSIDYAKLFGEGR